MLGTLRGPSSFRLYTLEPGTDANGPAIDPGVYPLDLSWSAKFARNMPHVLDVPGRDDLLIHAGDSGDDAEGCIILGLRQTDDTVLESRDALHGFVVSLTNALAQGRAWLHVEDPA
jgi:hypothetical protein